MKKKTATRQVNRKRELTRAQVGKLLGEINILAFCERHELPRRTIMRIKNDAVALQLAKERTLTSIREALLKDIAAGLIEA